MRLPLTFCAMCRHFIVILCRFIADLVHVFSFSARFSRMKLGRLCCITPGCHIPIPEAMILRCDFTLNNDGFDTENDGLYSETDGLCTILSTKAINSGLF